MRCRGTIKLACQAKQSRRVQVMRRDVHRVFSWRNRDQADASRSGLDRRVDEEDRFSGGDVFGQVGRPLLPRNHPNTGVPTKTFCSPFGEPRSDAIITTQRVATGKHQAKNRTGLSHAGAPVPGNFVDLDRSPHSGHNKVTPGVSLWKSVMPHIACPRNGIRKWSLERTARIALQARVAGFQDRTTRSTSSPSAETRSSARGICPKACVEQLRQGSKVRTTASTRFKMPSVNWPSFT